MALKHTDANLNLKLAADGKGGDLSLEPTDSLGNVITSGWPAGTQVAWSLSDASGAIIETPSADTLSAHLSLPTPPILISGVVPQAVITLPPPSTVVITVKGNPIDVVAGGPAGAIMVEKAD